MRRTSRSLVRSSTHDATPAFDVLADVLDGVKLRSRVNARYELTAPWGLAMDAAPSSVFYAVTRGACVLTLGRTERRLDEGDVVFVPPGRRFALRDRRGTPVVALRDVHAAQGLGCGSSFRFGAPGASTTELLVGAFHLEGAELSPLATQLPTLLHVRRAAAKDPRWIDATLGLIASEIEARPPGHRATVGRLADVLFVQALRAYAAAPEAGENGWLRALVAPRIGEVLQRMHERPAERWTLGRLARIAGMSRSAFAARFAALVGEPPLAYLTRWRMHRAMRLLRSGEASMRDVASAVGYANESSFGKAFRRAVGITAGEARRRAVSAPAPRA